jgi:hypothetical protein
VPAGRPKTRDYDAAFLVRCTTAQKDAWELARRAAEAKLPPGERLPLNEWVRAVLDEAAKTKKR